jgi:hypothetical protein
MLPYFDDDDPDPADYDQVIRHECAHVVISRLFREPIEHLVVGRLDRGEAPGQTKRVRWAEWNTECLIARAGETGDRIFSGFPTLAHTWSEDRKHIWAIVREHGLTLDGYTQHQTCLRTYFRLLDDRVRTYFMIDGVKSAYFALRDELYKMRQDAVSSKVLGRPVRPVGMNGATIATIVDPLLAQ